MIINGKWMNEPEIIAMISQLTADKKRLERQVEHGVKRGRWIWDSSPEFGNPYGSYVCSECDERQAYRENYCPNCGADMRGTEI